MADGWLLATGEKRGRCYVLGSKVFVNDAELEAIVECPVERETRPLWMDLILHP